MKKLLILALALSLSGCYQTVNSNDIETANRICAAHNSQVQEIAAYFNGDEVVQCTNRKKYSLE